MRINAAFGLLLSMGTLVVMSGCVDGNVSRRDDGNYPVVARDSNAVRMKEVLLSNPRLTPQEAYDKANAESANADAAAQAEYFKRQKKREQRDEFLKDLADSK